MRYSSKAIVALCGISLLMAGGSQTFGQDWSKEQNEIFELEKQYWDLYIAEKFSNLMKLFHEDFITWPHWRPKPIGKIEFVSDVRKQGFRSYELKPMAIKIFKDFAIIYVCYSLIGMDGNTYTGRVGHICIKQGRMWQIIAGYSGGSKADGK